MATVLEQYLEKQNIIRSQIAENSLPLDELLKMQEINYRICVIETFQSFCKSAPITTDINVLGYHFQMVDAYIRFILKERRFGPKTDADGVKKRETALTSFEQIVQDGKKRFTSFTVTTSEQYKKTIRSYVNTILPVWVQYRDTYINI